MSHRRRRLECHGWRMFAANLRHGWRTRSISIFDLSLSISLLKKNEGLWATGHKQASER